MNGTKPWWSSRAVWATLITMGVMVLGLFHINVGQADQSTLVDDVVMLAGAVGSLAALYGRVTATKQVTLTRQ